MGLPTGLWDLQDTKAEHQLGKPPFSPRSVEQFRAAAAQAEALAPEDGRLARTYHDLGTLLWLTGRSLEANVYLQRSLEIFERVDGRHSTWVGIVSLRMAEIDLGRGRNPQAMDRLQRAEGILVRTLGSLDPMALRASALMAVHSHDQDKARLVMDSYARAKISPDAILRLQLEQLGGRSTLPGRTLEHK